MTLRPGPEHITRTNTRSPTSRSRGGGHAGLFALAWIAILAGGAACAGCAGDKGAARDVSLLLVTIDTLRADRVGCYGAAAAGTPVMDRLAADGVRFDQAISPAPLTLPAHASLMTGLYPPAHGVRNNGMFALPGSAGTLAELLSERGYTTAAFIGAYPVASAFGLAQGFGVYDERFSSDGDAGLFYNERRASDVNAPAVAWLEALPSDRPFFAWVHYFDPHAPYDPPAPYAARFAGRPYDGEVAYADASLGELLEAFDRSDRLEDTLVIVTSDHGEGLGEHGEDTHGLFVYESTLRVPLIVRPPSAAHGRPGLPAAGRVVAEPVSLADVFPTALEVLTGEGSGPADSVPRGMSLAGALTDGGVLPEALGDRPIYAESLMPRLEFGWSELRVLRLGASKYIEAPRPELYDLASDPAETGNLAGGAGDPAAGPREALAGTVARLESAGTAAAARRSMDAEEIARLRSLGYLQGGSDGGGDPEDAGDEPRRDPKDGLTLLNRIQDAKGRAASGDHDGAVSILREVLSMEPDNVHARWRLAETLLAAGRPGQAGQVLDDVRSSGPEVYWVPGLKARALERQGDVEGALEQYRAALDLEPDPAPVARRAATMLAKADRASEALEIAERGLREGSGDAGLAWLAGTLASDLGEPVRAVRHFCASLRIEPGRDEAWRELTRSAYGSAEAAAEAAGMNDVALRAPDVAGSWYFLGLGDYLDGRHGSAAERLARARELAPADADIEYYYGLALLESGDVPAAERALVPLSESHPDQFQFQRALALVRERQGRRGEAVALLRRALELRPGDPAAVEMLERLGGEG